jgi:uncharacterized protein (DUF924 family)
MSNPSNAAPTWAADILGFWFGELQPKQWFTKDAVVDDAIRARFLSVHKTVLDTALDDLLATPAVSLAAVIALDQFPRNLFRGSPRAFSADAKAVTLAEQAIAAGHDAATAKERRLFYYLPFEHAEDLALQARSVALIATLGDPELDHYALAHQRIIERFGRFPHRNEALGRTSSPQEVAFLKEPMSSF